MIEISWIKLSVGLFQNRKIKRILAMPRGEEMLVFWLRLLCLSGQLNRDGALLFTEREPYNAESLAVECDLPKTLVSEWLETFILFGMMTKENGIYRITGWEKYQNVEGMERVREQNRIRKQRERALKREQANEVSRDSHVTVTLGHATEKEREKEQEKETLLSLCLACEESEKPSLARERLGGRLGQGLVMLSDAQMEDLLSRLSRDEFDLYVSAVAECEKKGKRFGKSHYEAILDMAARDRRTLPATKKRSNGI